MPPETFAVTLDELDTAIDTFIKNECEIRDDHYIHRKCGGGIRIGFLNLFYLKEDCWTLDPGPDGFGIGPKRVPYCERCFPPDGFKNAYAVRFPILRERKTGEDENYEFSWGNREISRGKQRLLLG